MDTRAAILKKIGELKAANAIKAAENAAKEKKNKLLQEAVEKNSMDIQHQEKINSVLCQVKQNQEIQAAMLHTQISSLWEKGSFSPAPACKRGELTSPSARK